MSIDKKNSLKEDNIDLREILDNYLRHWKWFLITLVLSICVCYVYLNFQRRVYEANMTIKIKNENEGDRSSLSAFKDLGVLIPASTQNLEDEIEILLSKDLIKEVIKSLNLNVQFYSDKGKLSSFLDNNFSAETNFYKKEIYSDPPLKLNFLSKDSIIDKTFSESVITIKSTEHFIYKDVHTNIEKKYAFGDKITLPFGDVIITPNFDLTKKKDLIGNEFFVNIKPLKSLSKLYAKKLKIEPKSEYSSILNLNVSDGNKKKAEDFLIELISKYNNRAIKAKELLTKTTSDFVNKRLEKISNELSGVDQRTEAIKTRYRLSDVASETGLNMESSQQIESQIVAKNTELQKIKFIKDIVSGDTENDLLPDIDVGDQTTSTFKQQYNLLMLEKQRLLKVSTEKNPAVVNITEQLNELKKNYNQNLNSLENTQQIALEALNERSNRISGRLYAAPKQERQYRDIKRQQQIKEQLYLYLLEKREETALTLGVADPNAEVVDTASSNPDPIAPKKLISYLGFSILGLVIPFLILYIINLLDTKVRTKEEIERGVNVPIIGDIPKFESKNQFLIKKDDYSGIAEAFRILRTNLNFIPSRSSGQKSKTLFITSTIAGEGKSFVSSNLATVLAHADKKTILVGMDIRAPKIKQYIGVRGKVGVTNFIIDNNLSPKDIIIDSPNNIENLSIISSGDLAPNPSELLMHDRLKDLFNYCNENYDYVIVDTPAYSMVTDTLLISKYADAFIYIIRANYIDRKTLRYVSNLANENKLANMMLLINNIDLKRTYGYGYGYGYGVENIKSNSKRKSKWRLS